MAVGSNVFSLAAYVSSDTALARRVRSVLAGASLSSLERMLLVVLSAAAGPDGSVAMSMEQIASRAGCAECTARRGLRHLHARGYLRCREGGGRGRPSSYVLMDGWW